MSFIHAAATFVSQQWLAHREVFLYLAPSAVLAAAIQSLSRRHHAFLLFYLAGTICHELAHYAVGLLTMAKPRSLSLVPRRSGAGWVLGAVEFANLRWYNAAPTALAPLVICMIPFLVALWRTAAPWTFTWTDAALALLLAPQFLSFWPSRQDWLLSLRSWPYLLLIGAACWALAR